MHGGWFQECAGGWRNGEPFAVTTLDDEKTRATLKFGGLRLSSHP
jgi:hypothetical protein